MEENIIDIKENYIQSLDSQLLGILLRDHSSGNNIIWATDNYAHKGLGFFCSDYIEIQRISGRNGNIIKPRVEKSKREQLNRVRDKAEVFTPSWVCNAQNNLIDEAWFRRSDVFNLETDKGWRTNVELVFFPQDKTWKDYVSDIRLEITCGEAPYLVSRYDTVTGDAKMVSDRIGLLDRKLRIVNENTNSESDWFVWTKQAYKSSYGYDWQGDNVLLARENLLLTFADYYFNRFNKAPTVDMLIEIAEIVSWNIWQMDGLKFIIPNSCIPTQKLQLSIFEEDNSELVECVGCKTNNNLKHTGIYCRIKDWSKNKTVKFVSLMGGKNE